jgi:hypothetical protein
MSEVRIPAATAKVRFRMNTELLDPPDITLEVKPLARKDREALNTPEFQALIAASDGEGEEQLRAVREMGGIVIPLLMECIVGWDLTQKSLAWPCEAAQKSALLLAGEGPGEGEGLLWDIVADIDDGAPVLPASVAAPVGYDPGDDEEGEAPSGPKAGNFMWVDLMAFVAHKDNFRKN